MNENVKRMIRDLNNYSRGRTDHLSTLVWQAANMIEELAEKVDVLEAGIPAEDWSRIRAKEYRQGQLNILKIIDSDIKSEMARVREELKALPPVTPTGHWMQDGLRRKYTWMCSRCHDHYRAMYDYCPSCGMKMEGEEQA
jgi:lipopolysaccharide biosynthesis regulator YciM